MYDTSIVEYIQYTEVSYESREGGDVRDNLPTHIKFEKSISLNNTGSSFLWFLLHHPRSIPHYPSDRASAKLEVFDWKHQTPVLHITFFCF